MDRRDFLKMSAGLTLSAGAGLLLPSREVFANPADTVATDHNFWLRPRRLHVRRQDGKGVLDVVFYRNGQYDEAAYRLLCHIFRDVRSNNAVRYMDVGLFNLIFGIQEWARSMGSYDPVYILNSGYRTDHRNRSIEGAAKNSLHVYGKASDGTFKGLPNKSVIAMADYFSAGGVGGYSWGIHTDVGRNRRWGTAK